MKNYFNLKKSKLLLLTFLTLTVGTSPVWAQKSLPYSYGFEEAFCSTSGWTEVNCNNSSENYKLGTSDAYEGEYAFRFYYTINYPQYLISPELATSSYSISVSFWYKAKSSSYEESFKVGYSTTDTETSSFTFGDEVKTESTNWQEYTTTCPAGTKYICIACTSNDKFCLYIDDLVVDSNSPYKTPKAFASTGVTGTTATFGWTAGGDETAWQIAYSTTKGFDADAATKVDVTSNPYTLEGLTTGTTYYARIRADYGSGNYSDWSSIVSFTTLEKYPIPTNVAAELTPGDGTVAKLSWAENGTATQWQICLNDDEENLITTDENPFNLTGLTPETTYTAKVRAVVGEEWSKWSDAVSFTPSNAYSVTINEGTTTNEYVPIYGYYVDALTKSQFVIPASSLQDMQWGNITKMTFYSEESSINWGNAQFEVYMTEQDGATLSSMTDYATMTKVKSAGSLSVSDGKMVVTLDKPYLYRGDDLVIGFLQTVKGSYVKSHWYGVTADGASFGGYGSSVSQKSFLPKTTFVFEPAENLTLAETDDNSTTLSENDGKLANVTLTRTLQAGGWNTFCVPFSTETPSGWTVKELSSSAFDSSTGELTLNFENAASLEAGKPYLVKVADNVVNPIFEGVTIVAGTTTTETTYAHFIPTLGKTLVTGPEGNENDTQAVLFVAAENTLKNPTYVNDPENESSYIKGFRAYFQLKNVPAEARSFVLNLGDESTGITSIGQLDNLQSGNWYDLSGRKLSNGQLSNRQMKKGVYIVNGKKVIK